MRIGMGPLRFEWTEDLRIGVDAVDAQHRELFARIAAFQSALESADTARMDETFVFLRDYVAVHFAREEALMRESAYPRLEQHRAAHADFGARLAVFLQERGERGMTPLLAQRVRNWVVLWLVDHIGGSDQALGRHLCARQLPPIAERAR